MVKISIGNDPITLDMAKAQCYVETVHDDTKISGFIKASLGYVEDYLHKTVLITEYEATQKELIPIDGYLYLKLNEDPHIVSGSVDGGIYQDATHDLEAWIYDDVRKEIIVNITDMPKGSNMTGFKAKIGTARQMEQITQARLMIIANYFLFRESDITMRVNEVPHGVTRILDNASGASL